MPLQSISMNLLAGQHLRLGMPPLILEGITCSIRSTDLNPRRLPLRSTLGAVGCITESWQNPGTGSCLPTNIGFLDGVSPSGCSLRSLDRASSCRNDGGGHPWRHRYPYSVSLRRPSLRGGAVIEGNLQRSILLQGLYDVWSTYGAIYYVQLGPR